jgi:hypothetical protein
MHVAVAGPGPYKSVVETEEVHAFPTHLKVHDPGLGLLRLQTELGQQIPKPL